MLSKIIVVRTGIYMRLFVKILATRGDFTDFSRLFHRLSGLSGESEMAWGKRSGRDISESKWLERREFSSLLVCPGGVGWIKSPGLW